MAVTKAENKELQLKKKIKKIYLLSQECSMDHNCPIKGIFAPAVDKWSLFCLYNLAYNKVLRFNKLKSYIPGISSRMLSVTLKKLEEAGMVDRQIYAEVPPKVEYRLTKFGLQLSEKLVELNLWIWNEQKK